MRHPGLLGELAGLDLWGREGRERTVQEKGQKMGREEREGREIAPYLVLKVGAYAMPHGTTERRHHITELQQRSTARMY